MTTVIAINSANDIYMDTTNNIALATGLTACEQAAQTASLAQLAEMVLFTTQGMPALQSVFVGTPNYALYRAALISAIEAINGIVAVTDLTISQSQGIMSYTATIETIYGRTVLNA